jgi:hypothetical protein
MTLLHYIKGEEINRRPRGLDYVRNQSSLIGHIGDPHSPRLMYTEYYIWAYHVLTLVLQDLYLLYIIATL